jgi:hypothetical protein
MEDSDMIALLSLGCPSEAFFLHFDDIVHEPEKN